MKFSVGYQLPDEYDSVYSICDDYRDNISNVYFSFGNNPSGRSPLYLNDDESGYVKDIQMEELKEIGKMGISLTLLYNANCYGEKSLSVDFHKQIIDEIYDLKKTLDIKQITTASPMIAESIKKEFGKDIIIFASVNMRIGTIPAMEQLSDYFDGFYIQKEVNRNHEDIKKLKSYADLNSKKLGILANSGCLAYCGFQTFHDNLVAHEKDIIKNETVRTGFPAPCWKYLHSSKEKEALFKILSSNWIRPEEVSLYEPYFDEMKLATRMHQRMRMVVSAYVRGRFSGNIMDLTEPSYSSLFKGVVLDNTLFPDDYSSTIVHCKHNCDECNYCRRVLDRVYTRMNI